MEIRTFNVPCSDLSVVWRVTWEDVTHGKRYNIMGLNGKKVFMIMISIGCFHNINSSWDQFGKYGKITYFGQLNNL